MASTPEQSKARRRKQAEANGRTVGKYKPTGLAGKFASAAEWRREYKRILRQKAGCKTREEIKDAAEKKRSLVKQKKTKPDLHDFHVRRFKEIMKWRKNAKQKKANLCNCYLRNQLKAIGIPGDVISAGLIDTKREAIALTRLSKQIRQTIKNYQEKDHEAITKHT